MNKALDQVTLLIPTYNRYQFLLRLLKDYLSVSSPILILDSSTDSMDRSQFQGILNRPNIKYLRYDSSIYPIAKMAEGLRNVSTPYAVICADDDFVVPSFFAEGVNFLQNNPDYSIVHGVGCLFMADSNGAKVMRAVSEYRQKAVEESLPSHRLVHHLRDYTTTFYSIHRTQQLRTNMELCATNKFGWGFEELMLSCLSVVQGKIGKIDRLYLLRDGHDLNGSWDAVGKKNTVFTWVVRKDFGANYERFQDFLANEIITYEKISLSEAKLVVQQAFWGYLSNWLHSSYRREYEQDLCKVVKNKIFNTPWLAKNVLPTIRFMRSNMSVNPKSINLTALLRPMSPYHQDFMSVYKVIEKAKRG